MAAMGCAVPSESEGDPGETTSAQALSSNERIDELMRLDGKIDKTGPNCVGSVLYGGLLVDDYTFVNPGVLAGLEGAGACKEVKPESRAAGDVVMAMGEDFKYLGNVAHVAMLTGRDQAFAKMGYQTDAASKAVRKNALRENIGVHLEGSCKSTLENSAEQEECFYTASARYLRCDFRGMRTRLEELAPYRALAALRLEILTANSTAATKKLTERLANIEASLVTLQQTEFPETSIANNGKIDPFLVGYRVATISSEEMKSLDPKLQAILVAAALVSSTEQQLGFLTEPQP